MAIILKMKLVQYEQQQDFRIIIIILFCIKFNFYRGI